jgi:hypothetical protein
MRRPQIASFLLVAFVLSLAGCGQPSAGSPAAGPTQVTALKLTADEPGDEELKRMIDEAIDFNAGRYMNANDHAAWQIVHGILAYGRDLKIYVNGELVSALDHLLAGGELRGWAIKPGDHGVETILEVGSKSGQGHEDQWLGYIAQTGVSPEEPIIVAGKTFKFGDLLTQAQWDVYEGMEASWTLMALSVYVPADTTWSNKNGETWSVERLIEMEARADLAASPCGGSHRMSGIAMALNRRLEDGGDLTGGWKTADDKVQECIQKAREHQQPDGTFSTNYWIRPSTSPDAALRLNTTGHTLEFLTLATSDAQLREPWIRRAAVELCNLLDQTRELPVECGGLYHAIHGLELYRLRMFGPRETSAPAADPAASARQVAPPSPPSAEAEAAQALGQTQR